MGVKDKKINIIGVDWKILFLGGVYKCIAQKDGAWTICRFKKEIAEKEERCFFRRGWYPNVYYDSRLRE